MNPEQAAAAAAAMRFLADSLREDNDLETVGALTADRATVSRMETTGTYRQELDAWKATTAPTPVRTAFRCPWDRCCYAFLTQCKLHDHIDVVHHGCVPA